MTAYFTICSANYLAVASVLGRSLRAADPDAAFTIYLVDDLANAPASVAEEFRIVAAETLDLPHFWDMAFRYTIMEFNTAVKPFCFAHAFDVDGVDRAVYLDPDIYVLKPLTEVGAAFDAGADMVLTPHALAPVGEHAKPSDRELLQVGAYNLGFCAMRNTPSVRRFLDWWGEKCLGDCRVDLENGLFVDQKFVDLAPSFVDRVHVLRHAGYNVAYWNLAQRPLSRTGEGYLAGGAPLVFFHFSGFDIDQPGRLSRHAPDCTLMRSADLQALSRTYADAVRAAGHATIRRIVYAYSMLADGSVIPPAMRRLYARWNPPSVQSREDAFSQDLSWCNQPDPEFGDERPRVTRLMGEVWRDRRDLRDAFDLHRPEGRNRFALWYRSGGWVEAGMPAQSVADEAVDVRSPLRMAARKVIFVAEKARPLYRRLPESLRTGVRKVLFNTAFSNEAIAASGLPRAINPAFQDKATVIGYLRSESGVGESARCALRALQASDFPAVGKAISGATTFMDSVDDPGLNVVARSDSLFHIFYINADETIDLETRIQPQDLVGRYRIGVWAWELPAAPKTWSAAAAKLHEIWTPSQFVADAIQSMGAKTVVRMPHAVAQRAAPANGRARFGLPDDRLILLAAFDFNSYIERKNPVGTVRAYKTAFPAGTPDRPVLVLKTHGGRRTFEAERAALLAAIGDDRDIRLIDEVVTRTEMDALIAASDIVLSLHRSEGFGLLIAEAMMFGRAVVATDYSGPRDFFDAEVGEAIGYGLIEVPAGAYPFGDGQRWADPDHDAAVDALRRLAASQERRAMLGEAAKARIADRLSPEVVGARMAERLSSRARRLRESAQSAAAGIRER